MRYNNIDSKDLYHNGVYPKLPLYIDQNIANYHKYFDDNFYRQDIESYQLLKELESYNLILYMDISGNIHCLLNNVDKIVLVQKLETFLTNVLSRDIFVVANRKECEKIVKKMGNTNVSNTAGVFESEKKLSILRIYELPIIKTSCFAPFSNKKMIYEIKKSAFGSHTNTNFAVNNLFYPTRYLNPDREGKESQYTLQNSKITEFLYKLCNNNEYFFKYLINWVAYLFQSIRDGNNNFVIPPSLVLIGGGKCNQIFWRLIRELFGTYFTFEISDVFLNNLSSKTRSYIPYSIIINFYQISEKLLENEQQQLLFKTAIDCMCPKIFMFDTDEIEIDLTEKYFVINLNDISNDETVEQDFLQDLTNDLENFSAYLTSVKLDQDFILNFNSTIQLKKKHLLTLENKVELFARIIISGDIEKLNIVNIENLILYEDVKKDFENGKIKQKNIIKLFDILYKNTQISGNSKGLMVKLRKCDKNFFGVNNIIAGAGGIKYFKILKDS